MAAPRVFDESDFDDGAAAPAAAGAPRVFDDADFDDAPKPGDPIPFGELAGAALGKAYEGSLPGRVQSAIADHFRPDPRPGDPEIGIGEAARLGPMNALGGVGQTPQQRLDAALPIGLQGQVDASQFDAYAPDQAESEEERLRAARAQHPFIVGGGEVLAAAPDLALKPARAGVEALEGIAGRTALRSGTRAAGYTPSLVKAQGPEAVASAVTRGLDEGIITATGQADEMLGAAGRGLEDVGQRLAKTYADLDSIKEGVHVRDLATRFSGIDVGQPGTRAASKLDAELAAIIDDASKYADSSGFIPASALRRVKDSLAVVYRKYSNSAVPDLEGVGGLTRQAHGEALGLENEVFERVAPGAIADKRRASDLFNLEEALEGAAAREAVAPARPGLGNTIAAVGGAVAGGPKGALAGPVLLKLLSGGSPQMRAVAARKVERVLASRVAPLLEQLVQAGEPAKFTAAVNALARGNPEFAALLEDEPEDPAAPDVVRSDERVKADVQPLDSKAVLRRYVQVQGGKRPQAPTTNAAPISSSPAAPAEKRREAYRMTHEGGKLRAIEGARKRITITRDRDGLPVSMELEEL